MRCLQEFPSFFWKIEKKRSGFRSL
uniref:Membrane protein n=1 Tax=Arundo donax TaxID=35708 RepID=A0A0A9G172_ARUDO